MLFNNLLDENKWNDFLTNRLDSDFLTKKEKSALSDFVLNKKYYEICNDIVNNKYVFTNPKKHLISKGHTGKKRTVYTYTSDEMIVLKYISFLLYEYDDLFSPNLYSFRKSCGVKEAIRNISKIKNISNMYGYKVDVKNYFNSIDVTILLEHLNLDLNDTNLYNLLKTILVNDKVIYNNEIIKEQKGVMAGTPTSAFLANYYIKEIDEFFWNQKVVYLRYADDIILFCNNEEELKLCQQQLLSFLNQYKLQINPEKEYFFKPNEEWEFLGFSFNR